MKRFLSTTAVLVALTGPALADGHSMGFGNVMAEKDDFFASDLIGMRIYNSETEVGMNDMVAAGAETEWDDIGEINDVIIGSDGEVRAVILGIGGFLGMGERDVSVSMDALKILREEDGDDRFLVVNTSQEVLEQAPEFKRDGEMDMDAEADTDMNDTDMNDMDMAERPMLTRPAIERDGYAEAQMADIQEMTADDLTGRYVYGSNDETVGEIDSLLMGDAGKISEAVINVGGFLGLGEKPVAVSFDELQVLRNADDGDVRVYIDSTKSKLEALPEHEG